MSNIAFNGRIGNIIIKSLMRGRWEPDRCISIRLPEDKYGVGTNIFDHLLFHIRPPDHEAIYPGAITKAKIQDWLHAALKTTGGLLLQHLLHLTRIDRYLATD